MIKLTLSTLLLLQSVNVYAKDLQYFYNEKLTVSLTNEKCSEHGQIARAKLTGYKAIHGCYLIKHGHVFIIWQNNKTNLFKTKDFKPLRSI
jgi:hypothetical protein